MAKPTAGDFIVERLHAWVVRRIYGYPGDGINGVFGAPNRAEAKTEFVQARHEEMAAFMASAHAKYTGELGVCITTSGSGASHLKTRLYDARMGHTPVLAIVGQQARASLGGHYQQELDLQSLCKDVAGAFVEQASVPGQVRHLVDRAIRTAISERKVTALILPNDLPDLPYEAPSRKHGTVHSGVVYHPCIYRCFCVSGCATNAKQSALVTWTPRAVEAGAEIRDLSMVGRIVTNGQGMATGAENFPEGKWRFQKAKNVVVAGYAIETPRLLLMSANSQSPDGLANSSGLVGKNLTAQANQGVFGELDEEMRGYKGLPSLSLTEHWNHKDTGRDFFSGYSFMSQGPMPKAWAASLNGRGLWGDESSREMQKYNHQARCKMAGEFMPQERNRVTLSDKKDRFGLPIARVTYSWWDNDRHMIAHAGDYMDDNLKAGGGKRTWREADDTAHLNGTARMGDSAQNSVVNADCRSWDIPNLWICDGSVFPAVGGVDLSLTIPPIALRTADRIVALNQAGAISR